MSDLIAGVVLIGLFFGGLLGLGEVYGRYQCGNYERITGKQTKYATLDTCYINTDKGWQRWDEYKLRAAASEGLSK